MFRWHIAEFFFLIILLANNGLSQVPPRLQIPGAIQSGGPTRYSPQGSKIRRPIGFSSQPREVRPVNEETEEPNYPSPIPTSSSFDDEVSNLQQINRNDADSFIPESNPLPFRPERPIPISREQIREKPQFSRPQSVPQRPIPRPSEIREENVPVRQQQPQIRQQVNRPSAPPSQQTYRKVSSKDHQQYQDEDLRERKPVSQILRKYRTDNEDGSITWGFENDDGTYKEETLRTDCIISGKYGYVDPDGVKREFTYEAGNKCDDPQLEEDELIDRPNIPDRPNSSKNRPTAYRAPQSLYTN